MVDGMTMTESLPILEYIEECHHGDQGVKLFPDDPKLKYKVRQLCEIINSGTQPIQNVGILNRVAAAGGDKIEWAKVTNEKGLGAFETILKETAGKYCVGDTVTLADAFLIP